MKKYGMRYGVLAYPAGHSLSPVMFNAAFGEMGIDAEYKVFEIEEEKLEGFMEKVRGGNGGLEDGISGLSVSLPYKEKVMSFLDEVDEGARAVGAVNTVWNDGGVLRGYNTDFVGARRALEEACSNVRSVDNGDEKSGGCDSLKGKKVIVMGAGGAVRGITYGLQGAGAEVEVYNRTLEKAEILGRDFGVNFGDLEAMKSAKGDVFIQATSIWLQNPGISQKEIAQIFPDSFLSQFGCVMDIVYKPLKTPLLKNAEKLGKVIVTGEKMLLYQAIEQFKIWTGKEERDLPTEVMKKSLKGTLNKALV